MQDISSYRPAKLNERKEDAPGLQELLLPGGRGQATEYILHEAQKGAHWNLHQGEKVMGNKNAARDARLNEEAG